MDETILSFDSSIWSVSEDGDEFATWSAADDRSTPRANVQCRLHAQRSLLDELDASVYDQIPMADPVLETEARLWADRFPHIRVSGTRCVLHAAAVAAAHGRRNIHQERNQASVQALQWDARLRRHIPVAIDMARLMNGTTDDAGGRPRITAFRQQARVSATTTQSARDPPAQGAGMRNGRQQNSNNSGTVALPTLISSSQESDATARRQQQPHGRSRIPVPPRISP